MKRSLNEVNPSFSNDTKIQQIIFILNFFILKVLFKVR